MATAHRGRVWFGLVAAAAYVIAVAVSMVVGHHGVRPLYEGSGPAAPYQWVNPPAAFAAGNTAPKEQATVTNFTTGSFPAAGVSGANGQVILNLQEGTTVPGPGDTGLKTVVTPLDPATLGPITATGLVADGNAYKITFSMVPSGAAVTKLDKAAQLILQVPIAGHRILYSADGTTWQIKITQQLGASQYLITDLPAAGYYLAASQPTGANPIRGPSGSGTSYAVPIAVGVAVLALALILAPILLRRRRRGANPPKPTTGGRAR